MDGSQWTFITFHALVLLSVDRRPHATVRQLAQTLGITERHVHRILNDLDTEGYITRKRIGRQNHYTVHRLSPVQHSAAVAREVADLLAVLTG